MGNWARVPAESRKTVWVWQNVVVTAIRRCHCKAFFSSFAFTTLRDTFTVKTFRFPSRPALTWPEFTIATPQWVPRGRNRLREQSRSGGILVWKWRPVYSSENKNLTLKGDQSGRGWDPLKETLFQPSILAFVVKMSWIFFSHTSLNDTFKAKNINFPSGRPKLRPTSLFVFILKQPPSLSPPPPPRESLWGWDSARKVSCSNLSSPFCPSRLRRLLARSRETRFARPKRKACSQATRHFALASSGNYKPKNMQE